MHTRLPDFRLEVYFAEWEFTARHHLTASDAETLTIRELLALATDEQRDAFERLPLGYTPTWGTPALLEAIASRYESVDAEHVLVFAGAEEAMFWTLQELVGAGEHAIVTVPNYQSMETIIVNSGAAVDGLALAPENGWAVDLDQLETMLRPETRLVAVNFPNNPTGALPRADTFAELVGLCEEREISLFSDEVFRGLERDPARTLPQAADLSASAISLNVMSKAYGLPGLRIGWLACRNRSLLKRLERRKHYTSICCSAPGEHLATIALTAADEILARNRAIIAENLSVFDSFFNTWKEQFAWEAPAGGCVSFPRLLTGEPTSSFCRRLVEQAGVLLLPADVFTSELATVPSDRFRIGVGRKDPVPALEALGAFLNSAPWRSMVYVEPAPPSAGNLGHLRSMAQTRARRWTQVDVFTQTPYAGNPVAVVLDGCDLDEEQMASYTRWSNLSEATFVLPATHPAADYRVRIFTSASSTDARAGLAQELPFAGHPTLGSCHAWLTAGGNPKRPDVVVQECAAGLVPIRRQDGRLAFAAPPLVREGPVEEHLLARIVAWLGIARSEIVDAAWADNGPGWVAVLLESAEAVLALQPTGVELDLGVVGPYAANSPEAFELRAFFPKDGATVEDPVTGSLNASVAQWLLGSGRARAPYIARQGTKLGRAGRIHIANDPDGTIWVGGGTITCISGSARL
jgi:PhzF family phenazine biosynthesis protein